MLPDDMTWVYIIHLILFLLVLILSFLPLQWIRKGLYILPLIIVIQWYIFDGCVVSKFDSRTQKKTFTQHFFSDLGIQITEKQASDFSTILYVFIPTFMFYRLNSICK